MSPPGLDQPSAGILEMRQGVLEKVGVGHEVRIKDGDEVAPCRFHPISERPRLKANAVGSSYQAEFGCVQPAGGQQIFHDHRGIVVRVV